MALHTTRRRLLSAVGMAATTGTILYTPSQSPVSPTLDAAVPGGTWPVPGRTPARTKHAPDAEPPTTEARTAWKTAVPVTPWNPTLAVDSDSVYVPGNERLTALDASTGREQWRLDTKTLWPPDGSEINVGPLVADDRLLLGTSNGLVSIDTTSGSVAWIRGTNYDQRGGVVVDETAFIPTGPGTSGVIAVDVATGGRRHEWSTDQHVLPIAFIDGTLVTESEDGISAFDPWTGEVRWRTDSLDPDLGDSPTMQIACGDRIVLGSNPIIALDPDDGTELWRSRFPTGEDQTAAFEPAVDGNRVFVSSYWTGETVALDAATGDEVWQVDEFLGSPIVANRTVFCLEEPGITALNAADGRRIGRFANEFFPGEVAETLAVAGDRLYAAYDSDENTDSGPNVVALEAP
ncbi:PQQ-binding-like beta-propeller repeat protein [Halorussus sp. AFM4]|uniref:outer membrane protein assembly factor BamB family protein n=1 Tax=Halorussus sp. AFM4 TaxID=3421651 RepID=UPI003EC0BF8B